jgi:alpha-glucosidase
MNANANWWKEAVIYQIYPRSFRDANGDGIGDLAGITEKLDHLVHLGVDAIWLSPIYPSPDADFGYDVSNYCDIDPKFGTLADFDKLVEEAHKRDLRIILDVVMNHTSDQHPWFLESRSSRDNPYRDWYIWKDVSPGGGVPNNWASAFGGSAWEWDAHTGQYYLHLFAKEQPDLNWRNPAVKAEMLNMYRFWCERGVDGFRLDVFNAIYKDANFSNNPSKFGLRAFDRQIHKYDCNQPEMVPFLQELRALLDSYPERYSVGEGFLYINDIIHRYVGEDRLHAIFGFEMLHQPWNLGRIKKAALEWHEATAGKSWPTQVMNNHDNARTATRYHADESDVRLKQSAAILLTLRGTPFMYYGEEIGMRNVSLRRSQIQDPPGRFYWPFYKGRDGCRTPMQWDASGQAGFTSGTPWLPVHKAYTQRNVVQQTDDPDSLFNFYRALIRLRKQYSALTLGDMEFVETGQKSILAYTRHDDEKTLLIAVNFSDKPVSFTLEKPKGWQLLLSNLRPPEEWAPGQSISLLGEEVAILGLSQTS